MEKFTRDDLIALLFLIDYRLDKLYESVIMSRRVEKGYKNEVFKLMRLKIKVEDLMKEIK